MLDGLGDLPNPERGWLHAARGGAHAEPRRARAARGARPASCRWRPGITPGSGPGHLGAVRLRPGRDRGGPRRARGARRRHRARSPATSRRAPTSAPSTPPASSPTGAPGASRARSARGWSRSCSARDRRASRTSRSCCRRARATASSRCCAARASAGEVSDADPHKEGKPIPRGARARRRIRRREDRAHRERVRRAAPREVLAGERPANAALMRGLSARPHFPGYRERFKLRAAAIAAYPMYRGVAQLAGMERAPGRARRRPTRSRRPARAWSDHDFFFIHVKGTDMAGEDGELRRQGRASSRRWTRRCRRCSRSSPTCCA